MNELVSVILNGMSTCLTIVLLLRVTFANAVHENDRNS